MMRFFYYVLLLCTTCIFGQVGINTVNPQADLHVNGTVAIENFGTNNVFSSQLLTLDNDNVISLASIPKLISFQNFSIPSCANNDIGDTDNFTIEGSDRKNYTITWEIILKEEGAKMDDLLAYVYLYTDTSVSAGSRGTRYAIEYTRPTGSEWPSWRDFQLKSQSLQVLYTFSPTTPLPFTPLGLTMNAYNLDAYNDTFSLNYADVNVNSFLVNIIRNDIILDDNDSCWIGDDFYFTVLFMGI